jgi:two-component system LytT family response regulator
MIRALLVDDEVDSIFLLRKLLEIHCPDAEVVGQAEGVESAIPIIRRESPDLVLLDVSMPDGSAFDLLNSVGKLNFQVIFISAYDRHAVEAFKYSAVDYLMKPVDGVQLRNAVERAAKLSSTRGIEEQLKVLLGNISMMQFSQQKIAVPTINGLMYVYLKDIMRMESQHGSTTVMLANGDQVATTRSILEYEDMLPGFMFFRVHNYQIVNLNWVRSYEKGRGGHVVMEDGSHIEVAIRRREDFLRKLLKQ